MVKDSLYGSEGTREKEEEDIDWEIWREHVHKDMELQIEAEKEGRELQDVTATLEMWHDVPDVVAAEFDAEEHYGDEEYWLHNPPYPCRIVRFYRRSFELMDKRINKYYGDLQYWNKKHFLELRDGLNKNYREMSEFSGVSIATISRRLNE